MGPSDLAADAVSVEYGDFESASSSLKRPQDSLSQNQHISSPFSDLNLIRNCLMQLVPGLLEVETVPVVSNNSDTVEASIPLRSKTSTAPIASLCNSDEMSARGMRRTSASSSMRCDDGMSNGEMLRPVQKSHNSRGRSHRPVIPEFVPPPGNIYVPSFAPVQESDSSFSAFVPSSDVYESSIAPVQKSHNSRGRSHRPIIPEFVPPLGFLPTVRSADPGDPAKPERMARIRNLRIDTHRSRFNSHLEAVRGVEQPPSIASRDYVEDQEQAPIGYAETKPVGVSKPPSDRHTQRGPRVVEIWKPSPLVDHKPIEEQAQIEANEKLYHCARVARAAVRRDIRRAEDAGRLLAGPTVQVPRKLPTKTKAENPDDRAVVDAVPEAPNAKEADAGVIPRLESEKADIGAISITPLSNASAEKAKDLDDDLSDYDVVESDVPGGSSFLAENDWLVVSKDDGF